MTNSKKIFSKQKQAMKTISMAFSDYKNLKSEEIIDKLGILNIYKSNIYCTVNLMVRVRNNTITETSPTKFKTVQHNYATRHSINNLKEPKMTFKFKSFLISTRGPRLWNKHTEWFKTIDSALFFKTKRKEYPVKLKTVTNYF